MNITRKIKMRWTARNVERIHKWLKINSDFRGWFERDGKRIGYKLCGNGYITFVFCE